MKRVYSHTITSQHLLLTCRDAGNAYVIQIDTGSRVSAVKAVDVVHEETVAGNSAPLRRHAAGHLIPAGDQARVQRRVFLTQNYCIRRRVRIVLPSRRARDAVVALQHSSSCRKTASHPRLQKQQGRCQALITSAN